MLVHFEKAREVAIEAARVGGKILLDFYQKGIYSMHTKEDTSLQTGADLAAEQAIIERIRATFPTHNIESEEQGLFATAASPYLWRIDPLDGTENFVLGLSYFSSTLTLCYENQPVLAVVYEPVTGSLYTAERDRGAYLNGKPLRVSQTSQFKSCRAFLIPDFTTKRQPLMVNLRHELHMRCRRVLDTWSPALDWCLVASGKADLIIAVASVPIVPDAGILILKEAGGHITDFSGHYFAGNNQKYLIGSNGTELHSEFLQLMQKTFSENEPSCQENLLSKPHYGMR
jgi:myo-inositol-1(or 4)-monophosphatase